MGKKMFEEGVQKAEEVPIQAKQSKHSNVSLYFM